MKKFAKFQLSKKQMKAVKGGGTQIYQCTYGGGKFEQVEITCFELSGCESQIVGVVESKGYAFCERSYPA